MSKNSISINNNKTSLAKLADVIGWGQDDPEQTYSMLMRLLHERRQICREYRRNIHPDKDSYLKYISELNKQIIQVLNLIVLEE